MTQILVTLEDNSNLSLIQDAIKMIRGVKNTIVTHIESANTHIESAARMRIVNQLAGCISMDMIDESDDRTKYLLSK